MLNIYRIILLFQIAEILSVPPGYWIFTANSFPPIFALYEPDQYFAVFTDSGENSKMSSGFFKYFKCFLTKSN